jgi:hypothetical protein
VQYFSIVTLFRTGIRQTNVIAYKIEMCKTITKMDGVFIIQDDAVDISPRNAQYSRAPDNVLFRTTLDGVVYTGYAPDLPADSWAIAVVFDNRDIGGTLNAIIKHLENRMLSFQQYLEQALQLGAATNICDSIWDQIAQRIIIARHNVCKLEDSWRWFVQQLDIVNKSIAE